MTLTVDPPDGKGAAPTISVFGLTLPITKWSISGFSIIALVAVAGLVYRQFVPSDMITLKQANEQLAFEVMEYGVHLTDAPERLFDDPDGLLKVAVYKDHCVTIQRRTLVSGIQTKLIPDPARVTKPISAIGRHMPDLLPVVEAAGQCLNNHGGQFKQEFGEKNGCLVDVWRHFTDGCEHVQIFNSCTGTWDSNRDGSPRVRWTRCVH